MAIYSITHTNGSIYATLGVGEINTNSGLSLLGQHFPNYGQLIGNNFLRLLENQANDTAPIHPIEGQLWWDSANAQLNVFNSNLFKAASGTTISNTAPISPITGDQWWNKATGQLSIYDNTRWKFVGPAYTTGQEFSGLINETVADTLNQPHNILKLQLGGNTVALISKDLAFTASTAVDGILIVNPGISLVPNTTMTGTALNSQYLGGIVAADYPYKGAASNTLYGSLNIRGLAGLTVGTSSNLVITETTICNVTNNLEISAGPATIELNASSGAITVSHEPTLGSSISTKNYTDNLVANANNSSHTFTTSSITALIAGATLANLNALSTAINNDSHFAVNTNATLNLKANIDSPTLTGTPLAPTANANINTTQIATTAFVHTNLDSVISELNSNINLKANIDSPTLTGTPLAPTANVDVATQQIATTAFVQNFIANGIDTQANIANLVVSGSISTVSDLSVDIGTSTNQFRNIYCGSISTTNSNLSELYQTDINYGSGNVVVFGGNAEVTTSNIYCDPRIAGIVSTDYAHLMNSIELGPTVAVTSVGKILCKVIGPVLKGDILVNSDQFGVATKLAQSSDWLPGCTIGKSLEDNNQIGIRSIMISVGRF